MLDAPPGALLGGRYEVIRRVPGDMLVAHDRLLGESVALRVFPSEELPRLVARLHAARRVEHPNVRRLFGSGEAGGLAFLILENVDGMPLAQLAGRLAGRETLAIARQLAAGLAALHAAGVTHGAIGLHSAWLAGGR